ncbi:MAG: DMP19 family protein [Spirochaetes bacterium]|nr:DMP19 family protein [Spirochaetota bacterium]
MHEKLTVEKNVLEKAGDDFEYLGIILDKYNALWKSEPQKFAENFNDNQITLFFYGILYNEVQNGGFLQLIFNGYAPYIFSKEMVGELKKWGCTQTAELIASITPVALQVANEADKTSLESLSNSYAKYPEFEDYDNAFGENDGGLNEVKKYVSANLSDFITVK